MVREKKHKVVVMFSGGLDSRVAVKILQEQKNLDIIILNFKLPFGCNSCIDTNSIEKFAKQNKVKFKIIDLKTGKNFQDYLDIIKNPKHGIGTALNPCKDCKIFMLKMAKKYADKIGAKIIATGEVLSQRPMSQLKHQLNLIEKKSELRGILLRPLSAKLLNETIAEKKGIINRNKLLGIQGRQRKVQMNLAEKYKIDYPSSGGGCLLCEKGYSKKLKNVLENVNISEFDIELTKFGRHLENGNIILGKDKNENDNLLKLFKKYNKNSGYNLIIPKTPGPSALIKSKDLVDKAKELMNKYSKNEIKGYEILK